MAHSCNNLARCNVQAMDEADISGRMEYRLQNLEAWNASAGAWERFHSHGGDDGNDLFNQCLLPVVAELAGMAYEATSQSGDTDRWIQGRRVLDLGTGSGILARMFAKQGADVTALDFSEQMLQQGRKREHERQEHWTGSIEYGFIDLMDEYMLETFMTGKLRFDIIIISTTLKSLPDLGPLARALPVMLKREGRIVIVDLHPAFSKPAGHRGMEVYEDPATGLQKLKTYIKVPRYLHIPPVRSEAVRGQPEPLWFFHRPLYKLLGPFFENGLVLDGIREPAFEGEANPSQAQNYHNFQQTPMLLAIRLRHANRLQLDYPRASVTTRQ